MPRIAKGLFVALLLVSIVPGAWAIPLIVEERSAAEVVPAIKRYEIVSLVRRDTFGEPALTFGPIESAEEKGLLDLLAPGINLRDPAVKGELANLVMGFPYECRNTAYIAAVVAPVPELGDWVSNASDNRRIVFLTVTGCMRKDPPACTFNQNVKGGYDFDFDDLKQVLGDCRSAIYDAIDQGWPFSAEYYKNP